MATDQKPRLARHRKLPIAIASCVISLLPVAAPAASPEWAADSWRWAYRSDQAPAATESAGPSHQVMPLYEIAMVSRLCASPDFQTNVDESPEDCARAVYPLAAACTGSYHGKFPRGDDAEVGGRLSHRNFAAAYLRCLRGQYHARSAAEINR